MRPRPGVSPPRALVFVFSGRTAKTGAAARMCSGPLGIDLQVEVAPVSYTHLPLAHQLFRQEHSWATTYGSDKR